MVKNQTSLNSLDKYTDDSDIGCSRYPLNSNVDRLEFILRSVPRKYRIELVQKIRERQMQEFMDIADEIIEQCTPQEVSDFINRAVSIMSCPKHGSSLLDLDESF